MSADAQKKKSSFFDELSWNARYGVLYPIQYFLNDASSFLVKPQVLLGGLILLNIVAIVILWITEGKYPAEFKVLLSVMTLGPLIFLATRLDYGN